MVNKEFYTPEIDGVVEKYGNSGFAVYSVQDNYFMSSEIAKILEELFECLQAIKPQMDGQDKVWALWIRSKRGPMSAFMDNEEYEELREAGEIKSQEELQSLRNDYYPEEINWHKTSFRIYDNNFIFGFDSKLILQLDIESKQLSGISFEGAELIDFLKWVLNDVETEIKAALNGIDAYNDFVTANLPLRKRFGRIKRMQLWQHVPEMERLDEDLGETSIKRFEIAVNAMNKDSLINDLTADKFFRYCEI